MKTLLHIDSSPLGEASISRQLSGEFVRHWKAAHPGGRVIRRDLNAENIPPIDAAWVASVYTPEASRTPEQRGAIALSDRLLEELFAADEFVFGVPMHNFGIPSILKLWLDQIARVGKTFAYVDGAPVGLLKDKKVTFLISSGGIYDSGTAMASFNFVEPYLRTVFGFLGVTEIEVINAGGAAALRYGKIDRESFLKPHFAKIDGWFAPALA